MGRAIGIGRGMVIGIAAYLLWKTAAYLRARLWTVGVVRIGRAPGKEPMVHLIDGRWWRTAGKKGISRGLVNQFLTPCNTGTVSYEDTVPPSSTEVVSRTERLDGA